MKYFKAEISKIRYIVPYCDTFFTGEVSIYYEYKAYDEDEMAVPSLNRNVTFKRQMSDV